MLIYTRTGLHDVTKSLYETLKREEEDRFLVEDASDDVLNDETYDEMLLDAIKNNMNIVSDLSDEQIDAIMYNISKLSDKEKIKLLSDDKSLKKYSDDLKKNMKDDGIDVNSISSDIEDNIKKDAPDNASSDLGIKDEEPKTQNNDEVKNQKSEETDDNSDNEQLDDKKDENNKQTDDDKQNGQPKQEISEDEELVKKLYSDYSQSYSKNVDEMKQIVKRVRHSLGLVSGLYGNNSSTKPIKSTLGLLLGGYDITYLSNADKSLAHKYYLLGLEKREPERAKRLKEVFSNNIPNIKVNINDETVKSKDIINEINEAVNESAYLFEFVNEKDINNVVRIISMDEILSKYDVTPFHKPATFGYDDYIIIFSDNKTNRFIGEIVIRKKFRVARDIIGKAYDFGKKMLKPASTTL